MTGTINGGLLAAETNRKRHGTDFYARIGRTGGLAKVPKGFALDRELASEAGKRGGARSSRAGVKNGEGRG